MEIVNVDPKVYAEHFDGTSHAFNKVAFAQLNKSKCERLHYLMFRDTRVRMGIVLGECVDEMASPFSAPFGGFSYSEEPRLEVVNEAIDLLAEYCDGREKLLRLTLPPTIYGMSFNAKVVATLQNKGFMPAYIDLNYHYDLSRFDNCEKYMSRNAKKNLHRAMKSGFVFEKLDSGLNVDVARAYNVIKINRESHGYALRMSLNDVLNTIRIIDADFFVLSHEGVDVAAAQVFHVADGIAQVVYWGDVPGYGEMRPMNMLSHKIFEYYRSQGLKVLDIGPSTEHGEPNYGLCEFKENLGCEISLKHIFLL